MVSTRKKMVENLFDLFRKYGHLNYGEDVTQLSHMIETAHLAEKEGHETYVILGALFHDIGHLCVIEFPELKSMTTRLGAVDHELIGATYLSDLGFPDHVCALVRNHVTAKRYLTAKYPDYKNALSQASQETLTLQGGPLSEDEMTTFESDPFFALSLRLRNWDDEAKKVNYTVSDLAPYESLTLEFLSK